MIAAVLYGGLGNQMFIYAMVRALSLRRNTSMAFNTNLGFKLDKVFKRHLELNCFNLSLPKSSIDTFDYPLGGEVMEISRKVGFNIFKPQNKFLIESRPRFFKEQILEIEQDNLFLEGYWQCEKYFKDFERQIKNDFTFKKPFREDVNEEANLILNLGETVMIGIRRYQECPTAAYIPVGLLSRDYYVNAIRQMTQYVKKPVFVVFTQDQEWAKSELPSGYNYYFVKPKTGHLSSAEDLYLIQKCKHFIISNSTYYWWGAWLADYDKKIVIAPDNFSNKDAVCDSWIKIMV